MNERCEPPPELRERIARAIHEGLGDYWAYANYGGDEWNSCRYMLDAAADKVLAIVTPPATVAALVKALEAIANAKPWTGHDPSFGDGYDMATESAADTARAALALYREAGR